MEGTAIWHATAASRYFGVTFSSMVKKRSLAEPVPAAGSYRYGALSVLLQQYRTALPAVFSAAKACTPVQIL
ncbi:hypothetical protein NPIL_254781 [Nephila pilipes]|uniref:Uncharacterized protein n=1 Tax=Nephila pilipes TaxID=299642 RepID=A0A8X6Q4X6_NEPPI|nr:hypothetical protein NPIL_254781 [Nephila pilipes]